MSRTPKHTIFRCVGLFSALLCAALVRAAAESSYAWDADGNIRATCHEDLYVARVYCNSWLDLAEHARIGQTFRCPADRLESVDIGQWRYNPGLSVRKQVSAVALTVRRDGPEGEVAAETVFARGKVPRGPVRIEVGMPSKPGTVWYVEVRTLASDVLEKQIFLNARCVDCYPDGALYLDGTESEGELCIRVVGSREVKGRHPGDVVFWSARPERRIWPTDMNGDGRDDLTIGAEDGRVYRFLRDELSP